MLWARCARDVAVNVLGGQVAERNAAVYSADRTVLYVTVPKRPKPLIIRFISAAVGVGKIALCGCLWLPLAASGSRRTAQIFL